MTMCFLLHVFYVFVLQFELLQSVTSFHVFFLSACLSRLFYFVCVRICFVITK